MDQNDLPKHHYVPVFYLKKWAAVDRLIEFSRPYGKVVQHRPCGPKGTGYQRGLYRISFLEGELAEQIERRFMRQVDNVSSDALDILLEGSVSRLNSKTRSGWTRFLIGMLIRNPESISRIRRAMEDAGLSIFDKHKIESADVDPIFNQMLRYVEQSTYNLLMELIDNTRIGPRYNAMRWFVLDASVATQRFLISDRPLIKTHDMSSRDSHIVVPISPTKLFVACNTLDWEKRARSVSPSKLVREVNRQVVTRAIRYVWSHSDDQAVFVQRHMSSHAHLDFDFTKSTD